MRHRLPRTYRASTVWQTPQTASRTFLPRSPARLLTPRSGRYTWRAPCSCTWRYSFPISPRANCADVEETTPSETTSHQLQQKSSRLFAAKCNLTLLMTDG